MGKYPSTDAVLFADVRCCRAFAHGPSHTTRPLDLRSEKREARRGAALGRAVSTHPSPSSTSDSVCHRGRRVVWRGITPVHHLPTTRLGEARGLCSSLRWGFLTQFLFAFRATRTTASRSIPPPAGVLGRRWATLARPCTLTNSTAALQHNQPCAADRIHHFAVSCVYTISIWLPPPSAVQRRPQ
jgi:hypothetical protein